MYSNTEKKTLTRIPLFDRLSKKIIHSAIQKDELQFSKAKTLLALQIFFLFAISIYSSFFLFSEVIFNAKALLNYAGLVMVASSLFTISRTQNIKNTTRILGYGGILLLTGGVFYSGGFASNDIIWYIVATTSSLLFIGKIDGLITLTISLLAIISFYLIDIMNLFAFPYDALTRSIHYRFANSIIILIIMCFLIWTLIKSNQRLDKLLQDIQRSQVRESFSQDFHDELGNKLATIVHISKRLKNAKIDHEKNEMLMIIENESQAVYDSFRDFVWAHDMNNHSLDSLFMYLTDFNQQFFTYQNIEINGQLLSNDYLADTALSSKLVQQFIPVFKEFMTNIYKHAHANYVFWTLLVVDETLLLKIKDDGVGFDTISNSNGQGLKSINKRVQKLRADYKLSSRIGDGTSIELRINLNNKIETNV